MRRSMRETARRLGFEIEAIESDGNHVHLLVTHPPRLSLSVIVQRLKGASSRALRLMRLPEILKKLWGNAFWSPSYFVVSCGGEPLAVVKSYVENQQTKHISQKTASTVNAKSLAPSPKKRNTLHPPTEVMSFRC